MSLAELVQQGADAFAEALTTKKRTNYFKINDGESVTVRFLQEIDEESPNYNEELGLASMATIVTPPGPEGYKHRYLVPPNLENEVSDWTWKRRLLINLAVVTDDGEEVMFWDTSKANARQLHEYNNEDGSITNRLFKIRRSGSGTETTYILMAKGDDEGITDPSKYEEQITQLEDYLSVLTPEAIKSHTGEGLSDDDDTAAGDWT